MTKILPISFDEIPLSYYENMRRIFILPIAYTVSPILFNHRKPRPLGVVRVKWLCLSIVLKSRWRSHESGVRPRPLGVDSSIQAISLLNCPLEVMGQILLLTFGDISLDYRSL